MRNVEIVKNKQRLDDLFSRITFFADNFELRAQWARYLCILVAGFVETSIRAIYIQYSSERAEPRVANYVSSRLKRFTNPNMEDILSLAANFDPTWRERIDNSVDSELKDAVDSIMALRNPIAHGVNTGISYIRVKEYYTRIIRLIELVENVCT